MVRRPSGHDPAACHHDAAGTNKVQKQSKLVGVRFSPVVFLSQLAILVAVLLLFSVAFVLRNGFFKVNLTFKGSEFIGLQNYRILLADGQFYRSVLNNLVFAAVVVASGVSLGFVLAVFLSLGLRFSKLIFAILFVPSILPRALIATVFRQMLEHHTGTVNGFLATIGVNPEGFAWLTSPPLAYLSVMGVFIYMIGLPLLYYNADLSTISPSILESARMDGAGTFNLMFRIVYPLVSASHRTIVISSFLASFRMFEIVFLLTKGGPGFTTVISGTYIFGFTRQGTQLGLVCAASTMILVLALLMSNIQIASLYRLPRKRRRSAQ